MYLSQSIWSNITAYLPQEERSKTCSLIKGLESNFLKRKQLHAKASKEPTSIYLSNISTTKQNSFRVFSKSKQPQNTNYFKFHISISAQDYSDLLYKSELNKLLQEFLLLNSNRKSLVSFKFVDPELLQEIIKVENTVKPYLQMFFDNIDKYRDLNNQNYEAKFILFNKITKLHAWLQSPFDNVIPDVNKLLEESDTDYLDNKLKINTIFNEICDSNKRVQNSVQYTLNLDPEAELDNILELITEVSRCLTNTGVRHVKCPDSDLPITNFLSFRQDKDKVNGKYIESLDPYSKILKQKAKNSAIYLSILGSLNNKAPQQLIEHQL